MVSKIDDRERLRDDSEDEGHVTPDNASQAPSIAKSAFETAAAQAGIDLLFNREVGKTRWEPARPPPVLGELMDSRFMLPLLLPSDPRMLAALPGRIRATRTFERSPLLSPSTSDAGSTHDGVEDDAVLNYVLKSRKLRDIGKETLRWVVSTRSFTWAQPIYIEEDPTIEGAEEEEDDDHQPEDTYTIDLPSQNSTNTRRRPSRRGRENSIYQLAHITAQKHDNTE